MTTLTAPRPLYVAAGRGVAIHAAEAATAVLTFTRSERNEVEITAIERLAAGLDPVVRWLEARYPALPFVGRDHVMVDADGLGQALWTRLGVGNRRGWKLYEARGRDRQALVDALLVAQSEQRVSITAPSNTDAMRKALLSYRRVVGEDGAVGAELVVALALAVLGKSLGRPRIY